MVWGGWERAIGLDAAQDSTWWSLAQLEAWGIGRGKLCGIGGRTYFKHLLCARPWYMLSFISMKQRFHFRWENLGPEQLRNSYKVI